MFLAAGDRGFCHTQDLSNGYVVVVEKEEKNSPDDMGTINMWAEKSSRVADARLKKRPLQSTSKPSTAAQDTNIQEADERTVITHFDAAKIRKDAKTAIQNDEKLREMRVYQGSGADLDARLLTLACLNFEFKLGLSRIFLGFFFWLG